MMMGKIQAAMAAFTLVCAVAGPAAADNDTSKRVLTTDDLLAIKSLSDPEFSPDGEWVAYSVDSIDVDADETSTQIFMVSKDGREVVQLTADDYSASSPRCVMATRCWRSSIRRVARPSARASDRARGRSR